MANCKGCGKEMFWEEDRDEKMIPLEKTTDIYLHNYDTVLRKIVCWRRPADVAAIRHDCPNKKIFKKPERDFHERDS